MFDVKHFELPDHAVIKGELKDNLPFYKEIMNFLKCDQSWLCHEITFNGQSYQNGQIVVVHVEDYFTITVGEIKGILSK